MKLRKYEECYTQSMNRSHDIVFETRFDAEDHVQRIIDIVNSYGYITRADLFEAAGLDCSYKDNKCGWSADDLKQIKIRRVRDGFEVVMPEVRAVDSTSTLEINTHSNKFVEEPIRIIQDEQVYKDILNRLYGYSAVTTYRNRRPNISIKNVIFNDPATIVFWQDGTRTVVKCGEGDIFDPEKGLAMAISKKALGNKGNYYEIFKEWIPEDSTEREEVIEYTQMPSGDMVFKLINPCEDVLRYLNARFEMLKRPFFKREVK